MCVAALFATAAFAQAPLRVGEERPYALDSRLAEGIATERGVVYQVQIPNATYIALHFQEFDLAPGASLIVSDPHGQQSYTMTGRGKMDLGSFWAQHIKGDTAILEHVRGAEASNRGFKIDRIASGFVSLSMDPQEAICGLDDKENAVCYQGSHPTEYDRSRAVARLLIQGSSLCTGWLASADNHFVTNEHCISSATAAANTDYEFMAEASNCGDGNCQLCHPGNVISGATFIQDNPSLDYALVQITSGNPSATYGYLEIDNRDAIVGEEIYIPQHPSGYAKTLGIESSDSADSPSGICHVNQFSNGCSSGTYQDVGYQCDTEGGSSGSPVLARSSHKVIALHHCANCPNRGVPIDLIFDEIGSIIDTGCSVNADCDDGNSCTTDTCVSGSCNFETISPCCGNGSCEAGEDCDSCGLDCVSGGGGSSCGNGVCEPSAGEDCLSCSLDCGGKQNGNPNRRFCCGDGDGENPVDCSDSRCTTGGLQCGDSPAPFCCGDASCDPGEDSLNCGLDCGSCDFMELTCGDGLDNDCDGDIDCNDSDCGSDPLCDIGCNLGQPGDSCTSNNQCCSNKCRGPNGAKSCR